MNASFVPIEPWVVGAPARGASPVLPFAMPWPAAPLSVEPSVTGTTLPLLTGPTTWLSPVYDFDAVAPETVVPGSTPSMYCHTLPAVVLDDPFTALSARLLKSNV